jgi:hypothetical protein
VNNSLKTQGIARNAIGTFVKTRNMRATPVKKGKAVASENGHERHLIIEEKLRFIHNHPEAAAHIDRVFFSVVGGHVAADYTDLPEEVVASIREVRKRYHL